MNRVSLGRLATVEGLFTSESVADGHPDKIADQLSDAVLDAVLAQDPYARVAVEAAIKGSSVWLFGELTGKDLKLDFDQIVRDVLSSIGHGEGRWGLDLGRLDVRTSITLQAAEIRGGVDGGPDTGAGDQGMMFGYACLETPERLPTPIALAHRLIRRQREVRDRLGILGPDAKAQVSVRYENGKPSGLHAIVLSSQHSADADLSLVREILRDEIIRPVLGAEADTAEILLNPAGTFVEGGPVADAGLTGRKIIADTYGGFARHGGGAFSGKDGTKVDRSGAYAARQLALTIVEAGLAPACEVRLAYAIGVAEPVAVHIDLAGNKTLSLDPTAAAALLDSLRPRSIIERLQLTRPGFLPTATFGHFGRPRFAWEQPAADALLGARITDGTTNTSKKSPPFDIQVATVLLDEVIFNNSSLTAEPLPRDGRFRTVWKCLDGTMITHIHNWASGMGNMSKPKQYRDHFKQEMPSWVIPMPPIVRCRLCRLAIDANQPLPKRFPQLRKSATTASRIAAVAEGAVQFTPG